MIFSDVFSVFSLTVILSGLCLQSPSAQAFSEETKVLTANGENISYQLKESQSEHAEREVTITHVEKRSYGPETSIPVLIGRDLDGDGKFDTWFYMGNDGVMEAEELAATSDDGWEAASVVLQAHTNLENRWLMSILLGSIETRASILEAHNDQLFKTLAAEEVELLDVDVRAKRIAAVDRKSVALLPMYETLSDGWAQISSEAHLSQEIYFGLADVALYVSGDIVLKYLKDLGPIISSFAGKSETVAAANEIADRYVEGLKNRFAGVAEHLRFFKTAAEVTGNVFKTPYEFLSLPVKERVGILVEGLTEHGKVGEYAADALKASGKFLRKRTGKLLRKIPSGLLIESFQIGKEVYDERAIFFSRDPVVLKQRVASENDLFQNLTFTTIDYAINSAAVGRTGNGKKDYGMDGVLSLVDSNKVSYWTNDKLTLRDETANSDWRAVGTGSRVALDTKVLYNFEKLSMKSDNTKLMLVGYIVSGIDQLTRYGSKISPPNASKASHAHKETAPESNTEATTEITPTNNEPTSAVVLTPILAPDPSQN